MGRFEIVMPKLGESIIEATITKWLKKVGDSVKEDESILEIATDKVDSEIPSPVDGVLTELLFNEGDIVEIGKIIAVIDAGGKESANPENQPKEEKAVTAEYLNEMPSEEKNIDIKKAQQEKITAEKEPDEAGSGEGRFYSPLVKNIARRENLLLAELNKIRGTGAEGRLTKDDLLSYIETKKSGRKGEATLKSEEIKSSQEPKVAAPAGHAVNAGTEDSVVEMDRIRQLISTHMVKSVQTSPHATSFVEADMTGVVNWITIHKDGFFQRQAVKLTLTPVFVEAIAKAIKDFPQVNVSVDGTRIIRHGSVNVGMAVSLPGFNLIVPVVRNADQKSLFGIIMEVNDLAFRARNSKLKPDEINGGTISLTNLGSVGTMAGTPIINQPQTAIVGVGAVKKRPVVMETSSGDAIAIRQMMILSLTFDHRVIDGALAGQFLNRMIYHLGNFDTNQNI